MPKPTTFDVDAYYKKKDEFRSICKLCKKFFKSSKKFNLKTHLERKHHIQFGEKRHHDGVQIPPKEKFYKTEKIKFDISKKQLIRAYIGLVTDEGVSFNVLNSQHMRTIIEPICHGIEMQSGKTFCLNADNCKKALSAVAENVVTAISTECSNNLISLQLNSSPMRNIYVLSAQFIHKDHIQYRILGIIELKESQYNSENVAKEILSVLSKYDINLAQVLSITSDYGRRNFSKLTPSFNLEEDNDGEEYVESFYENDAYFRHIDTMEENAKPLIVGDIVVWKCAAHTVQLVALEPTKNNEIREYIRQCRNIVMFIRKNINGYKDLYKSRDIKIPQLDCPYRWGSTYEMLIDIKNSKELVDSMTTVHHKTEEEYFTINEELWHFIESYCTALLPLHKVILKFQEDHLHFGDFYAKLLQCQLQIKKTLSDNSHDNSTILYKICSILSQSIAMRIKMLFDNPTFVSCLYLDPRFHHMLRDAYKSKAIAYLKMIWEKMVTICHVTVATTANSSTIKSEQDEELVDNDEDSLLIAFLDQEFYTNHTTNVDVNARIEKLELPYVRTSNVLLFWKERKCSDPELYGLSNVCFGVPATQVSVELEFPSLKIILAENSRSRLKEDNTLENILLAKLNPDFLNKAIIEDDIFTDDSAVNCNDDISNNEDSNI
ncbi:uncharacterized protein [Musca autumnalis]|uniref:uncharacterized protein n=1 Tax=Musca autumnalis TaxID=221902 RepID=UPI003CE86623